MRHSPIHPGMRPVRLHPRPWNTLLEYIHNLNEPLMCIAFVPVIFSHPTLHHSLGALAEILRMIRRCAPIAETTGTCISSARVAIGTRCGGQAVWHNLSADSSISGVESIIRARVDEARYWESHHETALISLQGVADRQ
jgi:hypothetical protein